MLDELVDAVAPIVFSLGKFHAELVRKLTMYLAMVPPLWFRMSTPLLLQWDNELATNDERSLAQEATRKSDISNLMASCARSNENDVLAFPDVPSSA